jgi:Arc/MetJ-type ribon-helix-helix transcriptional regulator
MLRKNFMITSQHSEWLGKESKDRQVSMSEVLRRALDAYFYERRMSEHRQQPRQESKWEKEAGQ